MLGSRVGSGVLQRCSGAKGQVELFGNLEPSPWPNTGISFNTELFLFFQGTISVGIDATDLFDRYDEEYEDVSGSSFPQIEINRMHISQSIEVRYACVRMRKQWGE